MDERRRFSRFTNPLEARWRAQSGASPCRLTDISWGGCFVQTLTEPSVGEATIVSVPVGDKTVDISGRVAYIDKGMGFAMEFDPMTVEQMEILKPLLGNPPANT